MRLLQIGIALLFAAAYVLHCLGAGRGFHSPLLQTNVRPKLQRVHAFFTDLKFQIRGQTPPREKIVIVDIDDDSLRHLGRWPWRRDITAYLIQKTFAAGARAVALDISFPEPSEGIHEKLDGILRAKKLGGLLDQYDSDMKLATTLGRYSDRLVATWLSEGICRPASSAAEDCPVEKPEFLESIPAHFAKFALRTSGNFSAGSTPLLSAPLVVPNIPLLEGVLRFSGSANAIRDADGLVRRVPLVVAAGGKIYPSMALATASLARGEPVEASLDNGSGLRSLRFKSSETPISVPPSGLVEVNYRGPRGTFHSISALDVLAFEPDEPRALAEFSVNDRLDGAIALIGVSALSVGDIAATPFDSHVPGVEVQATVIDNLLSGDLLRAPSSASAMFWILGIAIVFFAPLGIGQLTTNLEAYPALAVFAGSMSGFALVDQWLFTRAWNLPSGFLYLSSSFTFGVTLVAKSVAEEKKRKFLRTAFSKYVSPVVVDSLVKNPDKLSLGGRKEILTVLFCDIRGFTAFSETTDAKLVGDFLNDHMNLLTNVIFDHGGTVDKYIGDAVMAFWGAPLSQPDHALLASRAAVAALKTVEANRARFQEMYGITVQVGVGLHSGIAVVGNMGSEKSFNYSAVGDTVNVASRLESLTKDFGAGALVSRATLEGLRENGLALPVYRSLGTARIKGKKETLEVAELLPVDFPPSAIRLFDEGLSAYRSRQWQEAAVIFGKVQEYLVLTTGRPDEPTARFFERSCEYQTAPPPKDWDGSWLS